MTYPGIENDPAVAADPDRAAVEERRRARDEEYSRYVATQDIPWGSVPAYFEGEPVATTTAEKYGWESLGYVRRVDAGEPAVPAAEPTPSPTTAETVVRATTAKTVRNGGSE